MDNPFKTDMNRKTLLFGRSMLRPYIHVNFI